MAAGDSDWRELAKEVYRAAQEDLGALGAADDDVAEILKEDIREALLDLKQAVIGADPVSAAGFLDEVAILLTELRQRRRGSEDT